MKCDLKRYNGCQEFVLSGLISHDSSELFEQFIKKYYHSGEKVILNVAKLSSDNKEVRLESLLSLAKRVKSDNGCIGVIVGKDRNIINMIIFSGFFRLMHFVGQA